ncbi:hypothetical protein LY78DRAFT_499805 [Colletotrichum sublineola]|nr:hypothetical protein LY78DRAFT_499805 [Colletotrichum sublineola]
MSKSHGICHLAPLAVSPTSSTLPSYPFPRRLDTLLGGRSSIKRDRTIRRALGGLSVTEVPPVERGVGWPSNPCSIVNLYRIYLLCYYLLETRSSCIWTFAGARTLLIDTQRRIKLSLNILGLPCPRALLGCCGAFQ